MKANFYALIVCSLISLCCQHPQVNTELLNSNQFYVSLIEFLITECLEVVPTVQNGKVATVGSSLIGAARPVHCDPGFEVVGTSFVVCQRSSQQWNQGEWSKPGQCLSSKRHQASRNLNETPCLLPTNSDALFVVVENDNTTTLITDPVTPGTVVTMRCPESFYVLGQNIEHLCAPGIGWFPKSFGKCVRKVSCARSLPEVTNGHWAGTISFRMGATRRLICHPGFSVIGVHSVKCLTSGEWSPFNATCEKIDSTPDCGNLPIVPNGLIIQDEITCFYGYELEGNSTIVCLRNGTWALRGKCVVPQIASRDCFTEPVIQSGYIVQSGSRAVGSERLILCFEGYQLQGRISAICLNSGEWLVNSSCVKVEKALNNSCSGELPEIENGEISNDTLTIECHAGYTLQGLSELQCLQNGTWTSPSTCIKTLTCPNPIPPENAVLILTDTVHIMRVSCAAGYKLIGPGFMICNETRWSTPGGCELTTERLLYSQPATYCPCPNINSSEVLLAVLRPDWSILENCSDTLELDFQVMTQQLLNCGADPNQRDSKNRTGLAWAASHGNVEMVNILLDFGGDADLSDQNGFTPLMLAILNGSLPTVITLLNQENSNSSARNADLDTPLHLAAQMNDTTLVRVLIEHGVGGIDPINQFGQTPLMKAAGRGNRNVVRVLLEYGANENLRDIEGNAALEYAVRSGHSNVAMELL